MIAVFCFPTAIPLRTHKCELADNMNDKVSLDYERVYGQLAAPLWFDVNLDIARRILLLSSFSSEDIPDSKGVRKGK